MDRQALALVLVLALAPACDSRFGIEPQIEEIDCSPTWSPDGRTIAFVREEASQYGPRGIYAIDADGAAPRLLLEFPRNRHIDELRFSPAGDALCYVSYAPGCEVVLLRIGIGEEVVAAEQCNTFSPDVSPDGRMIVYTRDHWRTDVRGIYLLDVESLEERLLLGGQAGGPLLGSPRWSSSGEWIAFGMQRDIFIIRPDGTDLVRLTKSGVEGAAAGRPSWLSADEILYSLYFPSEHRWESRIIGLPGGGERRLPVPIRYGEISPDGREVVEMGFDGQKTLLFVRAVDDSTGATRRQLTYIDDP